MNSRSLRQCCGRSALALLIMFQLTLPVVAEADVHDLSEVVTTDNLTPPTPAEPGAANPDSLDTIADSTDGTDSTENPSAAVNRPSALECCSLHDFEPISHNPPGDSFDPDIDISPPQQNSTPDISQNLLPTATPPENELSTKAQTTENSPLQNTENSYRAMIIPKNGSAVIAGENTLLTATFTKLGTTPLASAFLYIPDSLTIVNYSAVAVSANWDYSWEATAETPGFSNILSLWANLDNSILGKDEAVSATFAVTATSDQEHIFLTAVSQERTSEEGKGGAPALTTNIDSVVFSETHINSAVSSAEDLNMVRNNPHWHYVQQNDINLEDFSSDLAGWQPIGTSATPFIGSYNGGGYNINNLTINRPAEQNIGLFGYTAPTTTLTGINLCNVDISGDRYVGGLVGTNNQGTISDSSVSGVIVAERTHAGGLVGTNFRGHISNCHTQVTVNGTNLIGGITGNNTHLSQIINNHATGTISGTKEVGGLVGQNIGLIKSSSFSGRVEASSATETRAGGLVGDNFNSATICCSFADATVLASNGIDVGGLVGRNNGSSISFSYATGTVSGVNNVGGLVGNNVSVAQVTNSYSMGTVYGSDRVGGLVGLNVSEISNCYSTAGVTGISKCGGLVGESGGPSHEINNSFYSDSQPQNPFGSAISDSALKTLTTYSGNGWSIAELENIDPTEPAAYNWYIEQGSSYPSLWWQHQPATEPPSEGDDDGDNDNPGPGPNPNPNPDPPGGGNGANYTFNPFNYSQQPFAPLTFQSAPGSTAHLVLINSTSATDQPLIGPGFILTGGWYELLQAEAAYNRAYTNYVNHLETDPGPEQTLLQLDLALARAAILALRQRLSADTTLVPAAQQAHHQALHLLNQKSHLLTTNQKAQAEKILTEILSVLKL
jgi:hypothetical protein